MLVWKSEGLHHDPQRYLRMSLQSLAFQRLPHALFQGLGKALLHIMILYAIKELLHATQSLFKDLLFTMIQRFRSQSLLKGLHRIVLQL